MSEIQNTAASGRPGHFRGRRPWAVCSWTFLLLGLMGCQGQFATITSDDPQTITNSLGMELVLVPAGEFLMGAPASDPNPLTDAAQPQHTVQISRPYYLASCEVTQEQFQEIMGQKFLFPVEPFFSAGGGGASLVENVNTAHLPVDNVNWNEADEFCRRLSDRPAEKAAGRVYRLPTEAEWEHACRAGTKSAFAFGEQLRLDQANFQADFDEASGLRPLGRTAVVGSYPANAWGLHDMHGNVWEWCHDSMRTYSARPVHDPVGEYSVYSVLRGGAWDFPAPYCRSDYRTNAFGGYVFAGFRIVCDVPKSD